MFRDGVWHLVEDKVGIRALEVRADKHDDAPIMSITSFTRPADDPEPEPDSDREEAEPEDKLPDDLDDEERKDLFELLGIGEGEASPPRGEAVSDQGGGEALDQGGSIEEPSGSKSIPKVKPMPIHDPKIMPSGKPCPPGFNWDGVRLVRTS